jgi:hypothetical protein
MEGGRVSEKDGLVAAVLSVDVHVPPAVGQPGTRPFLLLLNCAK